MYLAIKKVFKALFKIFSVLTLLFLLVSILVTTFVTTMVDINHYKTEIAQLVKKETGLRLEINSDMTLRIFTGVKWQAKDISLFNDETLIADINSFSFGLDPSSLYLGDLKFTSLVLNINTLNVSRDKKGYFNFLPLLKHNLRPVKRSGKAKKNNNTETDKLSLKHFSIENIQLSINRLKYLDELESVSITLNDLNTSLTLLPIIEHHDLVIDDPRVLVKHSYSGNLKIKLALFNQYEITDLSLNFKDHLGEFFADKVTFSLIHKGIDHAFPALAIDANGKLTFKINYLIPDGTTEPLWSQPEAIQIGKFDFNLPKINLATKQYQLEADQAHLSFEEAVIFESNQYELNDLLIKSLVFDSKQINFKGKNIKDKYHFKKVHLEVKDLPVIHKGKQLELMADVFLHKFAQKSTFNVSIDSISNQSQKLKNINFLLEGNNNNINLSHFSFNAVKSKMSGRGQLKWVKKIPQWTMNIHSNKLNLQSVANLISSENKVGGYASFDAILSGDLKQSKLNFFTGTVHTQANQYALNNLLIKSLVLNSKQINFKVKNINDKYHFKKVFMQAKDFPVMHNGKQPELITEEFLQNFSQKGTLNVSIDSISNQVQGLKNIHFLLKGIDKTINLSNFSFNAMESKMTGEGELKLRHKIPQWALKIHSDKLNLKPVANLINPDNKIEGYASVDTKLSGALQKSEFNIFSGSVHTKANNLIISGVDIDKILINLKSFQNVGLLDIGAIALFGPEAILLTKGSDYRILTKSLASKTNSIINQLNAEIDFTHGIATMQDVAFTTENHRFAVKGKINTLENTFIDFAVATVNKHGCPIYKKEVEGNLNSPSFKKTNALEISIINPLKVTASKVAKRLQLNCKEPFYTGVVQAP